MYAAFCVLMQSAGHEYSTKTQPEGVLAGFVATGASANLRHYSYLRDLAFHGRLDTDVMIYSFGHFLISMCYVHLPLATPCHTFSAVAMVLHAELELGLVMYPALHLRRKVCMLAQNADR